MYRCFWLQGSAKEKENGSYPALVCRKPNAFRKKCFTERFLDSSFLSEVSLGNSTSVSEFIGRKNGVFKRSTLCASKISSMFVQSDTKQKSSKSVFPGYKAELVYTGCDAVELCDSRVKKVMPWVTRCRGHYHHQIDDGHCM